LKRNRCKENEIYCMNFSRFVFFFVKSFLKIFVLLFKIFFVRKRISPSEASKSFQIDLMKGKILSKKHKNLLSEEEKRITKSRFFNF